MGNGQRPHHLRGPRRHLRSCLRPRPLGRGSRRFGNGWDALQMGLLRRRQNLTRRNIPSASGGTALGGHKAMVGIPTIATIKASMSESCRGGSACSIRWTAEGTVFPTPIPAIRASHMLENETAPTNFTSRKHGTPKKGSRRGWFLANAIVSWFEACTNSYGQADMSFAGRPSAACCPAFSRSDRRAAPKYARGAGIGSSPSPVQDLRGFFDGPGGTAQLSDLVSATKRRT